MTQRESLFVASESFEDENPLEEDILGSKDIQQLILKVEKAINENITAKNKETTDNTLFKLIKAVESLQTITTVPRFYPKLVEVDFFSTMVLLMKHENLEVAYEAFGVLIELFQVEENESEPNIRNYSKLVANFCRPESEGIETIVEVIGTQRNAIVTVKEITPDLLRISESIVLRALELIQTLVQFNSVVVDFFVERTELRNMLFECFNRNIQEQVICSELLLSFCQDYEAFFLQESENEYKQLDQLLVALSKMPEGYTNINEEELGENIFELLNLVLIYPKCQDNFLRLEGVELLVKILRSRINFFPSALKTLKQVTTGNALICKRFIQYKGLKVLFPMFSTHKLTQKRKRKHYVFKSNSVETRKILIETLANFFILLQGTIEFARICAKFQANSFLNCDRLLELYEEHLDIYETRYTKETTSVEEQARLYAEHHGIDIASATYILQLDFGLDMVQTLGYLIGTLICVDKTFYLHFKKKFNSQLNNKSLSFIGIGEMLKQAYDAYSKQEDKNVVGEQYKEVSLILLSEKEWNK